MEIYERFPNNIKGFYVLSQNANSIPDSATFRLMFKALQGTRKCCVGAVWARVRFSGEPQWLMFYIIT